MKTSEKITNKDGGYTLVLFSDEKRKPCAKEDAEHFEIQEYDADGKMTRTTYS